MDRFHYDQDGRRVFNLPKPIKDGKLTCPQCGCQDFRTSHTRPWEAGGKRRRKVCRHCGWSVSTVEVPVEE